MGLSPHYGAMFLLVLRSGVLLRGEERSLPSSVSACHDLIQDLLLQVHKLRYLPTPCGTKAACSGYLTTRCPVLMQRVVATVRLLACSGYLPTHPLCDVQY